MKKGGKEAQVVCIGSSVHDMFVFSKSIGIMKAPRTGSGYAECLELGSKNPIDELVDATGGGATNSAATFAKLGLRTAVCTEIGDDEAGRMIRAELKDLKIADHAYVTKGTKTAVSIILSHAASDRSILTYRGASSELTMSHFPLQKFSPDWFYVTSLHGNIAGYRAVLDRAEDACARVAWNPGHKELELGWKKLLPMLERTHLLIINREEAMQLLGTNIGDIGKLLEAMAGIAEYTCITDGGNGAWMCTADEAWHAKCSDVPIVSTTGAGDAFGSGLVAGFMKYCGPVCALSLAMMNSQSVIQHVGAKAGILDHWPSEKALDSVRVSKW
jgi:ribokinase